MPTTIEERVGLVRNAFDAYNTAAVFAAQTDTSVNTAQAAATAAHADATDKRNQLDAQIDALEHDLEGMR